jgi:hypothetical protein
MTIRLPSLPFKVYIVYDSWRGCVLQDVEVVRITPTKWWFKERGDLGFQCRTGCAPLGHALNPRQAWMDFRNAAIEEREDAVRRISAADKELAKL